VNSVETAATIGKSALGLTEAMFRVSRGAPGA